MGMLLVERSTVAGWYQVCTREAGKLSRQQWDTYLAASAVHSWERTEIGYRSAHADAFAAIDAHAGRHLRARR